MVFVKTNGAESQSGQVVASAQEEIRRLGRNGNALRPEEASSISAGGKIVGRGALTIFGHVEGELRASTIVIAEGAQMVGDVVAEDLTINGHVKGNHPCRAIEENARFEGMPQRNETAINPQSFIQTKRPLRQKPRQSKAMARAAGMGAVWPRPCARR